MKRCPQCRQTYADDNLNFCLSDGATLIFESNPVDAETVLRSQLPNQVSAAPPPSNSRRLIFAAIGLPVLLIGGAIIIWLALASSAPPGGTKQEISANQSASSAPNAANSNAAVSDAQAQLAALEKERQKLADERKKLEAKQKEVAVSPLPAPQRSIKNTAPSVAAGTWFVVLGSYPPHERGKADERLRRVQSLGFDAQIIETGNYPGFKSNLYSVVAGPTAKTDAQNLLAKIKPSLPDAYIKSGW